MATIKKLLLLWLPPIFWMGLIFYLSSFQTLQISTGTEDFVLRKLAHMTEYTILFLLIYRGLKSHKKFSRRNNFVIAFLITVFYASTDEYHQTFVSGRSGNLRDVGIDTLGTAFGAIAAAKIWQ